MIGNSIKRFRLDATEPSQTDWSKADGMSDVERHAAASSDLDALPMTDEQLSRMRRVPDVAAIRATLGLDVDAFARRFGLPPTLVRDWEERRCHLDPAAKTLLRVIERDPDAVARVAAE